MKAAIYILSGLLMTELARAETALPHGQTAGSSQRPSESVTKRFQDAVNACLAGRAVPRPADACIQVLGTCKADTIKAGTQSIRPIEVSSGTPCDAETKFYKTACGRGLTPDSFDKSDIRCGATQF